MRFSSKSSAYLVHGMFTFGLLACTARTESSPPEPSLVEVSRTTSKPIADEASELLPLFDGMGAYSRPIETSSSEAQRYFDQGMTLLFGFNHDEAIRSFEQAAALDPECAMAHWGAALARGPHINNPNVTQKKERAAVEALARALDATRASPIERDLIAALATRYADSQPEDQKPEDQKPEDRSSLEQAYADAMRKMWAAHPNDADIGVLFAEAAMNVRTWDLLWNKDGTAAEGTPEIIDTLNTVISLNPKHPLALHLMIHAYEASPTPERAKHAADTLRNLVPGHGHLQHMPSHIDVRTGEWAAAVESSHAAVAADRAYRKQQTSQQKFYRLYMAHNLHMLAYAAMMIGRSADAIAAMDAIIEELTMEWLKEKRADGYLAMPLEVRMRFGKWEEILKTPEFPKDFPFSRTMQHYARGVAFAAQGNPKEARRELEAFRSASSTVDPEQGFGTNRAHDIIGLAEKMLEGEVLYHEGHLQAALVALKLAVQREDALAYNEPADWVLPVRHALGAVLLKENMAKKAEAVFRADLVRLPNNGWALWGLARALRMQKRDGEAEKVDRVFEKVWKGADVDLHSSCMCLPGV